MKEEKVKEQKLLKCPRCDTLNSSNSNFCWNCGRLLKAVFESDDEIRGYFGPKLGVYVPMNSEFRDTYGDGLIYGAYFQMWWNEFAGIVEVTVFDQERPVPVTKTQVKNATTEGDWKYANTNLSLTPLMVSLVWSPSCLIIKGPKLLSAGNNPVWKGYVGIGAGASFVSERYRGEYYSKTKDANGNIIYDWLYASQTIKESLPSYQILVGFISEGRLGLDLKYAIIPTKSATGFSDLNGLSVSFSLFF